MRKFVYKPWGWYITLEEQKDFKVKRITLHPHQRFCQLCGLNSFYLYEINF